MKTVGKQLSEARAAKGWSPEMAARETKIRLDRLRELEEDDYSNFSSPTYARGFVRTYARALGIDEYRILRQLDNKLPEDDNASFANDTGVPYMPEQSQVAKPFQFGRGAYIAGGVGIVVLLFIGFILVQAYRADYFTAATPATAALPVTETNALPVVPDTQTARALPADSNAPPVALPVDAATLAANPPEAAPAAAPTAAPALNTNAPLRAQPVDLNALATAPVATPPAATATASAETNAAAPATAPAAAATDTAAATPAPTVATNTPTPPRAQAVDLNALDAADTTNVPTVPVADTTPAPASEPPPRPAPHALSARDSNSRPAQNHAAADKATQDLIASTATAPISTSASPQEISVGQPASSPVVLPPNTAPSDPTPDASTAQTASAGDNTPSSLEPASASPNTGSTSSEKTSTADKSRGKRLVLTASHDSFVRVISLDGDGNGQVRYSSMLKSGESISFNDHKYSINVGDPSAVDIALDGVNYGPHSENSSPDTFTVESHTP